VEIGLEHVVRNYVFGRGGLAIDLFTMVPVQIAAASSAHEATGFDAFTFFSVLKLLRSAPPSQIHGIPGSPGWASDMSGSRFWDADGGKVQVAHVRNVTEIDPPWKSPGLCPF
jgi:hypothetical protein